mmetsp:Transcript_115002/g.330336  ORF Transcript_115002/g.330336 Transcript_115002/m.330336 type:complete len:1210 (-) Transcript_115002:275-3904(-)
MGCCTSSHSQVARPLIRVEPPRDDEKQCGPVGDGAVSSSAVPRESVDASPDQVRGGSERSGSSQAPLPPSEAQASQKTPLAAEPSSGGKGADGGVAQEGRRGTPSTTVTTLADPTDVPAAVSDGAAPVRPSAAQDEALRYEPLAAMAHRPPCAGAARRRGAASAQIPRQGQGPEDVVHRGAASAAVPGRVDDHRARRANKVVAHQPEPAEGRPSPCRADHANTPQQSEQRQASPPAARPHSPPPPPAPQPAPQEARRSHLAQQPPPPEPAQSQQQPERAADNAEQGSRRESSREARISRPKDTELNLLIRQYEIGAKLGEGTFGVVHDCWKRRDPKKQVYAVKYIDKAAQDLQMILSETAMLRKLDHPNIVKCLDVFDEPAFMCIVMEKWLGRDVVSRLIEVTEKGDELSEQAVANLVRQMLASLQYVHSKEIVHRDVKMDNYLLDKPDLQDCTARVALADFGCAAYLKLGARSDESVGTKVYKSPEFIMENYDHKVDVWAVGISMYALLAGSLPFETERAILQVTPAYPSGLSRSCLDLLKRLLKKNDARRVSAAEGMQHTFLEQSHGPTHERRERTATVSKAIGFKNEHVDQSVVERREVLMVRGNRAIGQELASPIAAKSFKVSIGFGKSQESRLFSWWSHEDVQQQLLAPLRAQGSQGGVVGRGGDGGTPFLKSIAWTPQVLLELFHRHKVDASKFGQGSAKSISEIADEIKQGDCMLMQDVLKQSKLVRLVDYVVIQVDFDFAGSAAACGFSRETLGHLGADRLVVVRPGIVDSSRQEGSPVAPVGEADLPVTQRKPHETVRQTVERLLATELSFASCHQGCELSIDYAVADWVEVVEQSDLYPSIPTIKRRHIVPAKLKIIDEQAAKVFGLVPAAAQKRNSLGGESPLSFRIAREGFAWWSPAHCQARKISLVRPGRGPSASGISGLIRVRLNYTEAMVADILETHGFDMKALGQERRTVLTRLSEELSKGESTLCELRGRVVRVASVVLLCIEDSATRKTIVEHQRCSPDGTIKDTNRLPGVFLRPQEDIRDAVGRLLTQRLQLDLSAVRVNEHMTETMETFKPSCEQSPGLDSLYRRYIVRAEVDTQGVSSAPSVRGAGVGVGGGMPPKCVKEPVPPMQPEALPRTDPGAQSAMRSTEDLMVDASDDDAPPAWSEAPNMEDPGGRKKAVKARKKPKDTPSVDGSEKKKVKKSVRRSQKSAH